MAVSEISNALQMGPSKVSRMLRTLENERFFEKNVQTDKYHLGIKFFELGILYALNMPLRKIIRPHVEQIAKELNITASWGILAGIKVIAIDRVQNVTIDLISQRMGFNLPIYATAIGKAILAHLPEEEQNRILQIIEIKKLTINTIVNRKLIKNSLKLAKKRGYSTDQGETQENCNALAAPVRNDSGEVIAAISIMDEESRTSAETLFQFSDYLKEKCLFISRQIGYLEDVTGGFCG